jgi:hypothetical protein
VNSCLLLAACLAEGFLYAYMHRTSVWLQLVQLGMCASWQPPERVMQRTSLPAGTMVFPDVSLSCRAPAATTTRSPTPPPADRPAVLQPASSSGERGCSSSAHVACSSALGLVAEVQQVGLSASGVPRAISFGSKAEYKVQQRVYGIISC